MSVAIITRTKDRNLLLERALQSVIEQTYKNWKLIVVNDGGDAAQVDALLERYATKLEGRALVIHHEASQGMEAASNSGIKNSVSDYVVIHDDDDSWHSSFLEECIQFMGNKSQLPELGGVVTHWNVINEEVINGCIKQLSSKVESSLESLSLYRMLHECYIIPICFLYKRAALNDIGLYDETLKLAGDWEFNMRFMSKYEIGLIPKPLANYHKRKPTNKGSLANNVLETPNKLDYYANLVRNRYLRKDLKSGTINLGTLMNFSHHLGQLRLWHLVKNDLKKGLNKLRALRVWR